MIQYNILCLKEKQKNIKSIDSTLIGHYNNKCVQIVHRKEMTNDFET